VSEIRDVLSGLVWFGPCPSSGIWPYADHVGDSSVSGIKDRTILTPL